ncbi:MAG TPA: hypothetical protein ENJ37_01445 [Deltaproteobacteria bacterium]|nr:hypothetical protein [Deltaproteobacteria bacterium]
MGTDVEVSGRERALVVLTPSESKRLIAEAVCRLAEVRAALSKGRVVVFGGTTNAFVAERLTGRPVDRYWFAAGRIGGGLLGANERERRAAPVVVVDGRQVDMSPAEALEDFTARDVCIKGANAVDTSGMAGVLLADERGGSIGSALGIVAARGANLVVPVGLEKLIPSVAEAATMCGTGRVGRATGLAVGFMPIVGARVVTEIEAVETLFGSSGVRAVHVASGGVDGSEGAVVLALHGPSAGLRAAFRRLEEMKGEPPVRP